MKLQYAILCLVLIGATEETLFWHQLQAKQTVTDKQWYMLVFEPYVMRIDKVTRQQTFSECYVMEMTMKNFKKRTAKVCRGSTGGHIFQWLD